MPRNNTDQGDVRIDEAARQVTMASRPGEKSVSAEPSDRRPARRLSAGRKALVAVVAVLSIALIGVSAWFLFLPGDTGSLTEDALQTTVESSATTDSPTSDEPAQENAAGQETTEGDAVGQSGGQASPSSGESSNSSSYSSGAQEGSSSSTGGSSGSSQQQSATVTVSVSVSSSAVGGPVSGSANPTFNQGATAYDALCATGLSVNAQDTPLGIYITSVGGLAAAEHGGQSGWKYAVNGADPGYSAGLYVLQDGDVIAWRYVLTQDG